jgi:fumarate reductase subunit C
MTPHETKGAMQYTTHHPRWYRPRVSTYWWLWKWRYLKFVLRELSSIFVAYFVLITLLQIHSLSRGPEAYARFEERMRNPLMITLNAISFLFVLFHTITWFNLAPRAMVVRLGAKRVPEILIAGSNYVAWLVISASVAWFILR